MKALSVLAGLALIALTGCNSLTITQRGLFADEDGNLVSVEYGRLKKPRSYEIVSPVTHKTLEQKSNLGVRVDVNHRVWPEYSGSFTAYEGLNMLGTGTMYVTSNGKRMLHANGTTCSLFVWNDELNDYVQVFYGLITQGPESSKGSL